MILTLQSETTKEFKGLFSSWKSESNVRLTKIEASLAKIENSYSEIEKTLEFTSSQYDEIKLKTTHLEKECKDQRSQILSLEDQVEEMHRIAKINYIEIRNVPLKIGETKEDIDSYIRNMCKSVNVTVPVSGIKDSFRIPVGIKGSNPKVASTQHPAILAELCNNSTKTQILRAVKLFNQSNQVKINSSHLGVAGMTLPIYVAEHLTPKARRLHFVARTLIKSRKLQFCWISNGKIFVKKTEASPAIQIKAEAQLEKVSNTVI